jgi:hypothetical protein
VNKITTLFLALALTLSTCVGTVRTAAAMPPPEEDDDGCTYTVPPSVSEVNGRKNFSQVKAGDTLCLPAGERSNLKLIHLHGAPGKPITVRSSGGIVTIRGNTFLTGGISIYASSFLRVTGVGDETRCGAPYSAVEQKCGIVITGAHKGIRISTTKEVETLHDVEIDHIAVTYSSRAIKTRGISINPSPGRFVSGLYIHHNYVAGTAAEGIYMGTEPNSNLLDTLGTIQNLEISFNLVQQTGYDGIKIKAALQNVKVHHNVIRDTGLSDTADRQGGIKLIMSNGQFYNNYLENVFEGIHSVRPLAGMTEARYFNNVVVNSHSVGIEVMEDGALIFNNTVVSCEGDGIVAKAATAQVFDNIVAGCTGKPVKASRGEDTSDQQFNNLVGKIDSIGFVDPAKSDYRLRPDSKAIDAGLVWPAPLLYDHDDVPRPQGAGPDIGAFEYSVVYTSGMDR